MTTSPAAALALPAPAGDDMRLDASPETAARVLNFARTYSRTCVECGASFVAKRDHAKFCGAGCRKTFNNRAARRGVELYHLHMASRYDRQAANEASAWRAMNRLCAEYRREDEAQRAGRQSWDDPKEVLARNVQVQYFARMNVAPKSRR